MGFDLSVKNGALKSDNSGNMILRNDVSDGDIMFYVNDEGTDTKVLTLDGSENEIVCAGGLKLSATSAHAIDASGGTFASGLISIADGEGAVVGSDGMSGDPQTDTEDGYLEITVGGTAYQIPFYAIA